MQHDHPSTLEWILLVALVIVPLAIASVRAEMWARRDRRRGLTRPASGIDLRRARS